MESNSKKTLFVVLFTQIQKSKKENWQKVTKEELKHYSLTLDVSQDLLKKYLNDSCTQEEIENFSYLICKKSVQASWKALHYFPNRLRIAYPSVDELYERLDQDLFLNTGLTKNDCITILTEMINEK